MWSRGWLETRKSSGELGESFVGSRGSVRWVQGRRSRRVAGDRPELRGGGALVDLEHRGSAGLLGCWVARELLVDAAKLSEGCWSEGEGYL